jgi:hypothetical protein
LPCKTGYAAQDLSRWRLGIKNNKTQKSGLKHKKQHYRPLNSRQCQAHSQTRNLLLKISLRLARLQPKVNQSKPDSSNR